MKGGNNSNMPWSPATELNLYNLYEGKAIIWLRGMTAVCQTDTGIWNITTLLSQQTTQSFCC